MSIRVVDRVWRYSKASGPALLLLLAIADYANDSGTGAYPGVKTLAKKIRMSTRTVQRLIASLVAEGELWVDYRASAFITNQYAIRVGHDNLSPGVMTQLCHQGHDIAVSQGHDIAVSPNPLVNPSDKPSEEEDRPSTSDGPRSRFLKGPYSEYIGH